MTQNNFLNAYELLDIKPTANNLEIKRAYKKKALEFHPDKYNNSHPANTMFKLIVRAKEILLNPKSRLEHDYAIGLKKRPTVEPDPEVIFIDREPETDWGTIIGAGLVGLAVGAAFGRRKKRKKKS